MYELKRRLRGDAANNFSADLIERQDFLGESRARHKSRHPPDHAASLVLYDHGRSGCAQRLASL
jgi:hypothetical protein